MDTSSSGGFSTISFYGQKSKRRKSLTIKNSLERRSKRLKEEKIPDPYHSRLLGPSARWHIFYRQQDALDLARSLDEELHVFAFECDQPDKQSGQRQFLVATYPVFWHYYMQLDESRRHHYEVIPDGAVCKLYFDLEFQRSSNQTADGTAMVDTLTQYVCCWLKELYGVQCDRDNVLELTASTETKFSRHLIFQQEECVFKDNINAGHFVRAIFSQLENYLHGVTEKQPCGTDQVNCRGSQVQQESDQVCDQQSKLTQVQRGTDQVYTVQCSVTAEARDELSHIPTVRDSGGTQQKMQPVASQPSEIVVRGYANVFKSEHNGSEGCEMATHASECARRSGQNDMLVSDPHFIYRAFRCDQDQTCGIKDSEAVQATLPQKTGPPQSQDFLLCQDKEVLLSMEQKYKREEYTGDGWRGGALTGHCSQREESVCDAERMDVPSVMNVEAGERTAGERTAGERTAGERTVGERTAGERTAGERAAGERTAGERAAGERTAGERTAGERAAGERTAGERTVGERIAGERTAGERTVGEWTVGEGMLKRQVRSVCDKLCQQFEESELRSLFVKDKDGKDICFADMGVYTKNRNFRLYKSCKLGKKMAFTVAELNTYRFAGRGHVDQHTEQDIFLASLITNTRAGGKCLVFEDLSHGTHYASQSQSVQRNPNNCDGRSHTTTDHIDGSGKSPYPEVDDFICSQLADKGGVIRRWVYFPLAEVLNYDIVGYRFCYNVGRQHRSNNIKLVADLRHGVWYQKCYDPDCQAINFKSQEFQLPAEVLPAYFLADDFEDRCEDNSEDVYEDSIASDDDEVCLLALQSVEQCTASADIAV